MLNFDCLDLRDRIGDAGLIQWIYSEYPQWDQSSRRLTDSMDRKNTRSWKGDTLVADVDKVMCWEKGRQKAVSVLSGDFSDEDLDINLILRNKPGVDMLHPYSQQVGVLARDMARVSEVIKLDDVADDEIVE